MKIKYKIEMLSDWHIGSGLDSGADADLVVLKDENNLPYIPGKTIKGLLKDSLQEIIAVGKIDKITVDKIFGGEKTENNKTTTFSGNAFFTNAELKEEVKKEITSNNLSSFLYKNVASTRIDKNGIADDKSLRTMEVCVPVVLEGSVETEIENAEEILEKAFKWTRYIGVNRNRGLGRCKFSVI